jgi:hypothetical protein
METARTMYQSFGCVIIDAVLLADVLNVLGWENRDIQRSNE